MRTTPICRKCGAKITFLPMVINAWKTVYIPHNADDLKPHRDRCRENQAKARWNPPPPSIA